MQSIGERVAKLRESRNLTQGELARLLSVNQSAVSHWEKGIRNIPADQIGRIAKALNTSCDYLILGEKSC